MVRLCEAVCDALPDVLGVSDLVEVSVGLVLGVVEALGEWVPEPVRAPLGVRL